MKALILALMAMLCSATVVLAGGDKNQGTTGSGTTSTGSSSQGSASQTRGGR